MTTARRTSDISGPRRSTVAILAVLAAVLCGAATLEVAIIRPGGSASPVAAPEVGVGAPSAASSVGVESVGVESALRASPSPRSSTIAPTPSSPATLIPTAATVGAETLEPDLVLLGSWTVNYVVGPANGDGANIVIPLKRLDGRVIKPGGTFDFWAALGEVSRRAGYRRGAIIVGHHLDIDGALAGGICTVSTALFDAAARAGLPITARTSHSGYLAKYPLGLDAAVAKGDTFRQTMAFRNDTTQPIVIRTVSTPGTARVDLYGKAALGRTVEFSQPAVSHRQTAHDRHVATSSLPRGEHRRAEDRSDGMTVVVKRTVRAADGQVLRRDTWVSVYRWLDGLVLDGTG